MYSCITSRVNTCLLTLTVIRGSWLLLSWRCHGGHRCGCCGGRGWTACDCTRVCVGLVARCGGGAAPGPARAQACTLHQGCTPPTPATHPSVETRGPWAGAARLDPTPVFSFIKWSHGKYKISTSARVLLFHFK